jgi:hypothetical protein
VCTSCAIEAADRPRRTLYNWRKAGLVATESVGRQTFWNLAQLLEAEATVRPGRPEKATAAATSAVANKATTGPE